MTVMQLTFIEPILIHAIRLQSSLITWPHASSSPQCQFSAHTPAPLTYRSAPLIMYAYCDSPQPLKSPE